MKHLPNFEDFLNESLLNENSYLDLPVPDVKVGDVVIAAKDFDAGDLRWEKVAKTVLGKIRAFNTRRMAHSGSKVEKGRFFYLITKVGKTIDDFKASWLNHTLDALEGAAVKEFFALGFQEGYLTTRKINDDDRREFLWDQIWDHLFHHGFIYFIDKKGKQIKIVNYDDLKRTNSSKIYFNIKYVGYIDDTKVEGLIDDILDVSFFDKDKKEFKNIESLYK